MIKESTPYVTLSVFRFEGKQQLWAFGQMAYARLKLFNVKGLRFHKLLGSGSGIGFSLKPDWSKYAFLAVWDSEKEAQDFLNNSWFMRSYRKRSAEIGLFKMVPIKSYGKWSGQDPFKPFFLPDSNFEQKRIASITRATIKWTAMTKFWGEVPHASESLKDAPGRVMSIGIGEAPFRSIATFSIWENADAMKQYAYSSGAHATAVKNTREGKWFAEDLFARFIVTDAEGSLNGTDCRSFL